ncbi:MAG: carbon storage regulator [Planctomycetaceae bacterium]|nr:carbon storage regulator [Planctomycetaceae bacterium]
MLVLSRKSNEEIVIGSNIRVKILEINGNRVRLGISAPNHVPVLREEIFARMEANQAGELEFELAGTSAG